MIKCLHTTTKMGNTQETQLADDSPLLLSLGINTALEKGGTF